MSLLATPAHPGAWPREPGGVFVSLRADVAAAGSGGAGGASFYGEYGLTRRFTLVGQYSTSDSRWTVDRAGVALRLALTGAEAKHRFAVSFGVSAPPDATGVVQDARIESGLHWGTGFESRFGGGWVTATARLLHSPTEGDVISDIHGLLGIRPAEGWMTMISASRYEDAGGVTWKLSPSAGYQLHEKAWIVPGVTRELGGAGATTLGLALWLTF